MSSYDVDLFVIGAGSGGVRAARIAASHGARVMIAEEYRIGGTCVIRGCVPKKLMVIAGRFRDAFQDASGFGWTSSQPEFSWPKLRQALADEVQRLEGIYLTNLEKSGVTICRERAEIEGEHQVRLKTSGRSISARYILIASGAVPAHIHDIPGMEHAISSNEIFQIPSLPRHLVVYGGGYIALEFASVYSNLGSKVTLIYRGSKPLRGFDEDIRDHMMLSLEKRGIDMRLETTITHIDKMPEGLNVSLSDGSLLNADYVLSATGRVPNTQNLGLDKVGIITGEKGKIPVDGNSRTICDSIYAVGDVTDRINLTPVAIREGHAFADAVFGEKPQSLSYDLVPTAVFTTPEIGTVGMTEEQARKTYKNIRIFRSVFRPMAFILAGRDERVLMKLIVEGDSDRIVGVHIVGPEVSEIIQIIGITLTSGTTKAEFDRTIALHPSMAEELVLMREPVSD